MATKVFQNLKQQKNKVLLYGDRRCYVPSQHIPCCMSTITTLKELNLLKKNSATPTFLNFKRFLQCKIENNIVQSPFPDIDVPEIPVGKFMLDSFAHHGNRIAITCANTNHSYKYREVIEYSRIFGSSLIRQGFKPGDVLCIQSLNIPEYLIAVVGTLAIGGVIAPTSPHSPVEELEREFKIIKPKFLLSASECIETGLQAAKTVDSIEKVICFGKHEKCLQFKDMLLDDCSLFKVHTEVDVKQDPAFIMFTSGTTGFPKAAVLTHHNIIANLLQHRTEGQHKVERESVTLGILPFFHSFGMMVILLNYSIFGGRIITLKKFEPEVFLKKVTRLNVNRLNLIPYLINFLSTSPLVEKYNLSKVRYLVAGAAPLTTSVLGTLRKRIPNAVITQGFGMTELSPVSHNHPVAGIDIASIGYPVANTETKVVNMYTGETLGVNEPGEMLVRGPQVMKGYLGDDKATKIIKTIDGWLHTGDVGYYDKEGKFYISGRIKELIKFKGLQVSPKEIENILIDHPAIIDAGVVGIPHEDFGEMPAGLVVLHQDHSDFTVDDVHKYLEQKVSKDKQLVGGVKIVERIPRNSVGKMIPKEVLNILVG